MNIEDREQQYVKATGNRKPDEGLYNNNDYAFTIGFCHWYIGFSKWLSQQLEKVEEENEKHKWRCIKDELPEITENDNGKVNMVLVYHKDGFDCSGDIQVWNTIYLNDKTCKITHWMPLPESPII